MKPNLFCNNCGKSGHLILECKMPITSIGLIVFRENKDVVEYLMVCRKDSFGYSDFIKCKFPVIEDTYISSLINEMTINEKNKLLSLLNDSNISESMERKLNIVNEELLNAIPKVDLKTLIESSKTKWDEPEWGFPKGRRNNLEKDLDCALREFEEETGYKREDITLIENIVPYEEIFIGSNYKNYKHKYYVAHMNKIDENNNFQRSEISDMKWKTFDNCITSIRPYNLEKIDILKNIDKVIKMYKMYD